MNKIEVSIKGIAPLLQHRFHVEEEDPKWTELTGFKDYSEDVLKALYVDGDGVIYQPADHIWGAMCKAASNFKIPGKGKKTYKDLIKSACFVYPDVIPHNLQTWEVDRRPVVIQRARIVRERPRFDAWELDFEIHVMDKQLPVDAVKKILDHAGNYNGIGDFRPRFGRFTVTKYKEIK